MHNAILICAFLCMILSWCLPNHYFPWTAYYNEMAAMVSLSLFLIGIAAGRGSYVVRGNVLAALFFVAAIPFLQNAFGLLDVTTDLWMSSFYLLSIPFGYLVGAGLSDSSRWHRGMALSILAGALLSFFLGLCQWLNVGLGIWLMEMPPWGRPYANLAQPNNFASLLLMGLVSCLYLRETSVISRNFAMLCSAILLFGVVLSQSRTAVVGLLVLALWLPLCRQCGWKFRPQGLVLAVVWFVGLVWLVPQVHGLLLLEGSALIERGASSVARVRLWLVLLDAVTQAPWVGFGWNQVGPALVDAALAHEEVIYSTYAHNILIDLVIWAGVPLGIAIFLGLVFWVTTRGLRMTHPAQALGIGCLLVLGVHAMLELPHAYAYFIVPASILMGMVDHTAPWEGVIVKRRILLGGGFVAFAAIVAVGSEYHVLESSHREMRYELAGIGVLRDENAVPEVKILTKLADFQRFARTMATEGMNPDRLDWMKDVSRQNAFPPVLFRLALAYGLNGRADDAAGELGRLRVLHGEKTFAEARINWQALQLRHPQLADVSFPD